MNLEEKVMAAMKTAMKEKDSVSLSALRAIKSAIMRFKTDQPGADFTAEEELKLLTKIKKQLSDSIEVYTQQNRPDLADEEKAQLAVIEQFLPQPLSEAGSCPSRNYCGDRCIGSKRHGEGNGNCFLAFYGARRWKNNLWHSTEAVKQLIIA